VKKALLLMQQNIDTPCSVVEIARRLGVSRRLIERRFQTSLGMAPTLAYKIMRLEYAEFLLRHTQHTVTEIATSTGFCDSSHFIRAFRERRSMTPVAFRENA
jgi:transcriptional regulator GlxA family with amidase domain